MSVISRPAGSGQRSRLAGASAWAMTYPGEAAAGLPGDRRDVADVEGRGAGQRAVPPVLADVREEQVEPADPGLLHAAPAGLGGDVGQIAFQQRPAGPGERIDAGAGEERAE